MTRWLVVIAVLFVPAIGTAGEKPPTVEACVAAAERDQEAFSEEAYACFRACGGAELIAGLRYAHKIPAVTERVHRLVENALCSNVVHTPVSAKEWLRRVLSNWKSLGNCAWSLAEDRSGRAVLIAHLKAHPREEWRLAMLRTLVRTGVELRTTREGARLMAAFEKEVAADDVVRAKQAAEAERIWKLESQPDRVLARIRNDLAAGNVPSEQDIYLLTRAALESAPLLGELLTLAESEQVAVRRRAAGTFLFEHDTDHQWPEEARPQLLRVLMIAGSDREQPRQYALPSFVDRAAKDISAEEAKSAIVLAEKYLPVEGHEAAARLFAAIAEPFAEYRPLARRYLLGADREVATRLLDTNREWVRAFAREWVFAVSDEELRDEATQERFLLFAERAGGDLRGLLPDTRLAHRERERYRCGTGMMEAHRASENLALFGRGFADIPEAPEPELIPAASPMTPMEATLRWQQFVLARQVLRESPSGG